MSSWSKITPYFNILEEGVLDEGIYMSKNEQFKYVIIEDYRRGELSRQEAADILGVSIKSVQRWAKAIREKGIVGIKHGNCGRSPINQYDDSFKNQIMDLVQQFYFDFNIAHAREMLIERHDITVSYGTFHKWCRKAGLGRSKRRRPSKARIHRERMANEGLMLQMDGSHHPWNGKKDWCLIAMIDDATSDIPYAEFFPSETTWACLKVLRRVIEKRGIPHIIYTDRAGWAGIKRENFTQFKRVCDDLGIRLITTSSPQSKGRIENAWKTIQGRLVPELRLHNISSMLDANRYLQQNFLPLYWAKRNTVIPRNETSRYRPVPEYLDLDLIFTLQDSRIVASDHCISYQGKRYRITTRKYGSLKGKTVTTHQNREGNISIYLGHIKLEIEEIKINKKIWRRGA